MSNISVALATRISLALSTITIAFIAVAGWVAGRSIFDFLIISIPLGIAAIVFAAKTKKPFPMLLAIAALVFPIVYPFAVMTVLGLISLLSGGRFPADNSWV